MTKANTLRNIFDCQNNGLEMNLKPLWAQIVKKW